MCISCSDRMINGDESDVDCGGLTCTRCADAKICRANTDCASGTCTASLCTKLASGKPCIYNSDCTSGTCLATGAGCM